MEKRTPLVDIVMLVHDQAAWADLAIRAVEAFTRNPFRLIVVDSASKEPATHALLKTVEDRGHTVIRLGENKSFSNGVNAGVSVGTSKFIAILNDDAIVTEGWDSVLLQVAASKHVGLAGPYSGAPGNVVGDPPFLIFMCVVLRREVWNTVGPLDEVTFDGFSSEDLDYSWRVAKAGLSIKIAPSAIVLHAGSRTLAATVGDAERRQANDKKYNERLVEKWGREWVAEHTKVQGRGLVATFHAEEMTRVQFMGNLMGLKRSDGIGFQYYHHSRTPIHAARTLVADYALDNGYDWLVQLDDDATFPTDLLRRLLTHQKDIVCALAYQRGPPHFTCAFEIGEDGLLGRPMEGIEHTGLRRVDVSGFHCSVMRTSVIKRLREGLKDAEGKVIVPGTRLYYGGFDNKCGEDFAFSLNCKKIGVLLHVDTELISGHIGSSIVVDEEYKKRFLAGR